MCECFGTTQPFFKYTCASISWSPVMRRRDSLSCRTSRSMSSQRYHVARSALTAILHDGGERQRYRPGASASKQHSWRPLKVSSTGFVSEFIEHDLIDELNIFVNPVAIGRGLRIFKDRKALRLIGSTAYPSGVVINTYQPVR